MSLLISHTSEEYQKNKRIARRILCILGSVCLIWVGVITLYKSFPNLMKQYKSNSWHTTPGIIIRSEVRSGYTTPRREAFKSKIYGITVEYEFKLHGSLVRSERISMANARKGYSTEDEALEALKKFSLGKEVRVYYNPNDRTEFCIVPGVTATGIVLNVFGFSCLFLGMLWLFYIFRVKFRKMWFNLSG